MISLIGYLMSLYIFRWLLSYCLQAWFYIFAILKLHGHGKFQIKGWRKHGGQWHLSSGSIILQFVSTKEFKRFQNWTRQTLKRWTHLLVIWNEQEQIFIKDWIWVVKTVTMSITIFLYAIGNDFETYLCYLGIPL